MKHLISIILLLMSVFCANAQDIDLHNQTPCGVVEFTIIPTVSGTCTPDPSIYARYQLAALTDIPLDIQSGGVYTQISWVNGTPAPGAEIYSVSIINVGITTPINSAIQYMPCTGSTVYGLIPWQGCAYGHDFYCQWRPGVAPYTTTVIARAE